MKNATFAAGVAMIALALAGCQSLQNLHIDNPNYVLREIRPNVSLALPISSSAIDLDFLVEVQNPNPVGVRLDRIDFNVFVNDNHLIDGITPQSVRIPARGTGDVRIRTTVGYDNLKSLFREVAGEIQGNRARYEIRGRAYYNTPVGPLNFPFTVLRTNL